MALDQGVIHDKYKIGISDNFVIEGEEKNIDLQLSQYIVPELYRVTGIATDQETNEPLKECTVKIFNTEGLPIAHAETNEDGVFAIDVEAGTYNLSASLNGYFMATFIPIIVTSAGLTQNISLLADIDSKLSNIYGLVVNGETNKPLCSVTLSLYDSTGNTLIEQTVSAEDGEYVLSDLQPGTYKISASKAGYYTTTPISIAITAGQNISEIIKLNLDYDAETQTISGKITDIDTKEALENVLILLYSVEDEKEEQVISITRTNIQGRYMFGDVDNGKTYKVKAKSSTIGQ